MGYDSPGFPDQLPGFPPRSSHDYGTAPGSAGADMARTGPVIATVPVTPPYGTSPDVPLVGVLAGDTRVPAQAESYGPAGLCGSGGGSMTATGAGSGGYDHYRHPNGGGTA
jgi:hypothetical protein